MGDISPEFEAHLASGATTLCNCWKLVRVDGMSLGFTDHDVKIEFEGQVFDPLTGWQASAIEDNLGASIDTHDVIGVLNSEQINEADIAHGRYDGARVESYRVNWQNVEVQHLRRVDTIGEIVRQDGVFRAELRSATAVLNRMNGRRYQYGCDAVLGDGACSVDLETASHKASITVQEISGAGRVVVAGISGFEDGWFSAGFLVWTSGENAGLRWDIAMHKGGILALPDLNVHTAEIGDTANCFVGCNRDFATCKKKFSNQKNYRGFPHMPGNDFSIGYPLAGAGKYDGGSLNS